MQKGSSATRTPEAIWQNVTNICKTALGHLLGEVLEEWHMPNTIPSPHANLRKYAEV